MRQDDDQTFIDAVRGKLDASSERLEADVAARLDAMRRLAVASCEQHADELEPWAEEIGSTLSGHESLPPAIESRLNESRRRAVARYETRRGSGILESLNENLRALLSGALMPTGMVASAFVLVTAVSLFYANSRAPGNLSLDQELSLVASAEDLELYENLDFYLWLADNGLPD